MGKLVKYGLIALAIYLAYRWITGGGLGALVATPGGQVAADVRAIMGSSDPPPPTFLVHFSGGANGGGTDVAHSNADIAALVDAINNDAKYAAMGGRPAQNLLVTGVTQVTGNGEVPYTGWN